MTELETLVRQSSNLALNHAEEKEKVDSEKL
jgi:hypothetical protein